MILMRVIIKNLGSTRKGVVYNEKSVKGRNCSYSPKKLAIGCEMPLFTLTVSGQTATVEMSLIISGSSRKKIL